MSRLSRYSPEVRERSGAAESASMGLSTVRPTWAAIESIAGKLGCDGRNAPEVGAGRPSAIAGSAVA